jgi:hypothetical protein
MARDLPATPVATFDTGSFVWHFGHSFLSALEACERTEGMDTMSEGQSESTGTWTELTRTYILERFVCHQLSLCVLGLTVRTH